LIAARAPVYSALREPGVRMTQITYYIVDQAELVRIVIVGSHGRIVQRLGHNGEWSPLNAWMGDGEPVSAFEGFRFWARHG